MKLAAIRGGRRRIGEAFKSAMDYDLRPQGQGVYALYHGDLPALDERGAPAILRVPR